MAHALLGRKLGMTQVFDENGRALPVTVLKVGPCVVTRVKTEDGKDGYNAIQIGFEEVSERKLNKARLGELTSRELAPQRFLREFRVESLSDAQEYNQGDVLDVTRFDDVEFVDVRGTTKGRGFTGVIKRHGFKGAKEASHGTHEYFRHGGAIGASAYPARVHKNKRMPGHYGNEERTVQNLEVVKVIAEDGLMLVKGSVPGPDQGLVEVRPAVRK